MKFSTVLILLVLAFITGCDNNKLSEKNTEYSLIHIQDIGVEKFAEIKNIPKKAKNKLDSNYQSFKEMTSVSSYILTNDLVNDHQALALKLLENRNHIVLQQYFDAYLKGAITADAVQRFYEENKNNYTDADYEIQYFSLPASADTSADSSSDKLVEKYAEEVSRRIKNGEDFETIYTAMVPNANRNMVPSARLSSKNISPEIKQLLSTLNIGEISKPIALQGDYRVIKLINRTITEKPLNDVYNVIEYDLKEKLKKEEYSRLLKEASSASR